MQNKGQRNILQSFLVKLEQDFERSGYSRGLDLAPKSAFVAADTIHDATDVSEMSFKFFFQDLLASC
jgi:hypothetical protein